MSGDPDGQQATLAFGTYATSATRAAYDRPGDPRVLKPSQAKLFVPPELYESAVKCVDVAGSDLRGCAAVFVSGVAR